MFPYPLPLPIEDINKLKMEIEELKQRVKALENKDKNNYLEKEEGLYIL